MSTIKMSEEIDHHRRRFCGATAIAAAAAHLGIFGSAEAQASDAKPAGATTMKPGTDTSFAPLKQIDAGLLNVGYAQAGPPNGQAVILLQGWPYDIHSYVDVAPLLASAGRRKGKSAPGTSLPQVWQLMTVAEVYHCPLPNSASEKRSFPSNALPGKWDDCTLKLGQTPIDLDITNE